MKELYQSLAEKLADPGLLFLNYGFAAAGDTESWVHASDARYRCHLSLVHHVLQDVDLRSKTVLEVGCGRGGNCYYLARYTTAGQIVGLDCCLPNVVLARRDSKLSKVQFLAGDAQKLPFADESFGVVLNLESAHCYSNFPAFLAESARVLAEGGTFCFADLWEVEIIPVEWPAREKALENSSLKIVTREDISEQVFQALNRSDGMCEELRRLALPQSRDLVERIVRGAEALRIGLASGCCSYYVWKMRKDVLS
jgi:ubiquinone/menaquinone biosynthesis C-methylase UbiE